jgi:hypothetical protein
VIAAAPSVRCRACAFEAPADAARCPNCSAALGQPDPCPSCRAVAGSSPSREFRYVCDVCGAPRVPRFDRSIKYSGREIALLRKAESARKARALWRAAAIADGLLLPIALILIAGLMVIFGANAALVVAALLVVLPIGGFLAFALSRAGTSGDEIEPALDAAWLSAATDIARQTNDVSVAALAHKLGIEEPQAEELMALVDVNEMVSPGARMRVEAPPAAAPGETQVAAAEEEAALVEQMAAEEKRGGEKA